MHGGSYAVLRRIRIALEHWNRMPLEFQEQSVGRHKNSGAPLGRDNEFDRPDLTATGNDGDLLIPESAHIRLAAAATNEGAQILRRPYSYNDGVDFTIERWPPWPGCGVRRRAVVRMLSTRPSHWLHQDFRQADKV